MSSSSGGGGGGGGGGVDSVSSYVDFVGIPGSGSSSGSSIVNAAAASTTTVVTQQNQGMAGLLIMLAVLCFIFAYCCWGAPFCRSLCRRYCCCCCCCCSRLLLADDANAATDSESGGFVSHAGSCNSARSAGLTATRRNRTASAADPSMLGAPTIILLPHGRMLVVDGAIFTQLQADSTGLDFVELGESVMRAQRNPNGAGGGGRQLQTTSQASIIEMDAETPSKDSMGSIGCFPPPTYESIYGKDEQGDMPPSYSDILLHRLANLPFEIEDYSRDSSKAEAAAADSCPRIISNPFASHHHRRTSAAASSASNERNYSSLPRNPSLQCNPLDAYFVDDELQQQQQQQQPSRSRQRRRSASTLSTSCAQDRTRRTSSCGDGDESRTNDAAQLSRSDNVVDGSWDEISRAPMMNDGGASEEAAAAASSRGANPIHARSRRSTTASPADDDAAVQVHRYPEARYISDEENDDDEEQSDDNAGDDDQANNFKVLADIRESRV